MRNEQVSLGWGWPRWRSLPCLSCPGTCTNSAGPGYRCYRSGALCDSRWSGALGVELFAIGASELIHRHILSLIVIGLLALATVALLLLYMKPQLTTLRPILAGNSGDVSGMDPTADGESVAAQPVYRETAAPVAADRDRAERLVYPQGADQPRLPGRHRKPVYPEAAEPIATYRDQDGHLAFPPVPDQSHLPGRHHRPEAQDVADTAASAVLTRNPSQQDGQAQGCPKPGFGTPRQSGL